MSTYTLRCLTRQIRQLSRSRLLSTLLIILVATILLMASLIRHVPQADKDQVDKDQADKDQTIRRPAPQLQPPRLSAPPPIMQPSPTMQSLEIPKRLHHYFGDLTGIPERLSTAVNSWANNHKAYEVYFWDSRYLEQRVLPTLHLYQQYRSCYLAERHTVAKLIILLTFGGVLVDPDLISMADFNIFIDGSACVAAQELPEVAALVYGLDGLPSLRFAACRPKHPFLQLLLDRFCAGSGGAAPAPVGPTVIGSDAAAVATAAAFRAAFDAAVSAYDDECASRVCDYRDRIVLASASVFLPVLPTQLRDRLLEFCRTLQQQLDADNGGLRQRACRILSDPANQNLPGRETLAKPLEPPGDPLDGPLIPLNRIERNVGRKPILNIILTLSSFP